MCTAFSFSFESSFSYSSGNSFDTLLVKVDCKFSAYCESSVTSENIAPNTIYFIPSLI